MEISFLFRITASGGGVVGNVYGWGCGNNQVQTGCVQGKTESKMLQKCFIRIRQKMHLLASYLVRPEWLIPQPDLGRAQLLWKRFNFLQTKKKANVSLIEILI